jgi:hypothetical protein
VGKYLRIAEKANEAPTTRPAPPNRQTFRATKAPKATKAPDAPVVRDSPRRDISDRSDKRPKNFTPLTVSEALAGINAPGTGAGKNAELYRNGELSEEMATEYVTCAILYRRGESFEVWKHHAPAVRKALSLCIHELEPEKCNVCNGHVRRLIEEGGT